MTRRVPEVEAGYRPGCTAREEARPAEWFGGPARMGTPPRPLHRRRFLTITAAALGAPMAAAATTVSWRGSALGAVASITLGGTGRAAAAETFAAVAAEVDRLEDIFSLYRPTSALSRLNRDGRIDAPPPELVMLLELCDALHRVTGGAFDPTVQPVWRALAEGRSPEAAKRAVGWDGVEVTPKRITLTRPGMALTLNGIAQGEITDRVAALLVARGYRDVLVDMGEIAAGGTRAGAPWRVDVAAPDGRVLRRLRLSDRALAVSATAGTVLGPDAMAGHILDPRPGGSGPAHRLVAVSAPRAAVADGLSTGCCLLTAPLAARAVAGCAGARLEELY